MLTFCLTAGDGVGWAIDEDARLIREALRETARERPAPFAPIVHSPFWVGLDHHHPGVLSKRVVVAQADNPPFFYLTQPEFALAWRLVDLWVARSREALAQFEMLGLPARLIPYAVDTTIFRPLDGREAVRAALGLRPEDYVVGNFHRDTEGLDLTRPKFQKAPEVFAWVMGQLRAAGVPAVALLAGPRRHWLVRRLRREGLPFVFAGQEPGQKDDLHHNILPRAKLAELYAACDVYLITSRWEGGPQSVMEAAACGCKVLSTRVGVALDLLDPLCLYETPQQAVELLIWDWKERGLDKTRAPHLSRCRKTHSHEAMAPAVRRLYEDLRMRAARAGVQPADFAREAWWRLRRRLPQGGGRLSVVHRRGLSEEWDERMRQVSDAAATVRAKGTVRGNSETNSATTVQIAGPEARSWPSACAVVAGSVPEAVRIRAAGCPAPIIVFPFAPAAADDAKEPLVAEETTPAEKIAAALAGHRPVVYPECSSIYWQVFHGGVSYGSRRPLAAAMEEARRLPAFPEAAPARDLAQFLTRLMHTCAFLTKVKAKR